MPVNMDPAKKRRKPRAQAKPERAVVDNATTVPPQAQFGEETEEDRVKALADAENKNLWDATEVIDMDKF